MGFDILTYRHDTNKFYDSEGVVDRPRDEIDRAAMIYTSLEARIQNVSFSVELDTDYAFSSFHIHFSEGDHHFRFDLPKLGENEDYFDYVAWRAALRFGKWRYLKNK